MPRCSQIERPLFPRVHNGSQTSETIIGAEGGGVQRVPTVPAVTKDFTTRLLPGAGAGAAETRVSDGPGPGRGPDDDAAAGRRGPKRLPPTAPDLLALHAGTLLTVA